MPLIGLGPQETGVAKRLMRQIIDGGRVSFSRHALEEMVKDGLTTVDCVNVLRGGVVEPPEFDKGSWRYRVKTNGSA
ncbi:MAG TPA: hypothetical protein VNN07_11515 [Candidatus Tectomicrobia bacterium]|nr:hypothetical protein [Candidatus Tectomicrobia bacterium]